MFYIDGNEEYYHLLIENQVYLKALERPSVKVAHLGFKNFTFSHQQTERRPNSPGRRSQSPTSRLNRSDDFSFLLASPSSPRKGDLPFASSMSSSSSSANVGRGGTGRVLQAVIPADSQVYYLDRLEETVKQVEMKKRHQAKQKKRLSPTSAARLYGTPNPHYQDDNNKTREQEILEEILHKKQLETHQSYLNRPLTQPVLPNCGRLTNRLIKEKEDALQFAKERERQEKKKKLLGRKLSAVDADGLTYVYNSKGYRVTLEEYEKERQEIAEKKRKEEERRKKQEEEEEHLRQEKERQKYTKTTFNGAILEKTSKYVENLRIQAEKVIAVENSFILISLC